jgi:hypothetical protein
MPPNQTSLQAAAKKCAGGIMIRKDKDNVSGDQESHLPIHMTKITPKGAFHENHFPCS